MKTNINKNKVNNYFTAHLIKISLFIFLINTSIAVAQSNSCTIALKVDKDRNTRSTPANGTFYALIITNNGKITDTIYLSSIDANSTCSNSDGSSTKTNVILDVEFLDKNLKPINEIKINSGETINFFAHIIVPKGTLFDKWSCSQVIAKSKLCSSYKVDAFLHTLVINSNEDN